MNNGSPFIFFIALVAVICFVLGYLFGFIISL